MPTDLQRAESRRASVPSETPELDDKNYFRE
jgi:hypothetical protein